MHKLCWVLIWLGTLVPRALAAVQPVVDVHFAVLTSRAPALQRATVAQMQREVDILNTYFKGADDSKPVLFHFKDVVYAQDLPASACPSMVALGDLNQEYDYATLMAAYRGCSDARVVDPKAINFYVYDSQSAQAIVAALGPASQTIDSLVVSPASLSVGSTSVVSASASSGLPVAFSSQTPATCAVLGNTVSGLSVGTCIVLASQEGDARYAAAPIVAQSVPVAASLVPVCTLVAQPPTPRKGASATLSASCSPQASSYAWSGGTCAPESSAVCMVTPLVTTRYSVVGRNASGAGAAASAEVTVRTLDLTPILMLLLD